MTKLLTDNNEQEGTTVVIIIDLRVYVAYERNFVIYYFRQTFETIYFIRFGIYYIYILYKTIYNFERFCFKRDFGIL